MKQPHAIRYMNLSDLTSLMDAALHKCCTFLFKYNHLWSAFNHSAVRE